MNRAERIGVVSDTGGAPFLEKQKAAEFELDCLLLSHEKCKPSCGRGICIGGLVAALGLG